jgi:hypothetical protein
MKRVVAGELFGGAVGQVGQRPHPPPRVVGRRLDEDVDVFGQADDALQREGVAADQRVLDPLSLEELGDSEDVLVRRRTRSINHRSQSRLASSWLR